MAMLSRTHSFLFRHGLCLRKVKQTAATMGYVPAALNKSDRGTQTSPILGGRMFSEQKSLAKFPVPPLQQTMSKYLYQLQTMVTPEELERTKKIVAEFSKPDGVGERLQRALLQNAKKKDNWLADWWLDAAYLSLRYPTVINVSPGIVLPRQDFDSAEGQVEFAAKLITGILNYNYKIAQQTLKPDMQGDQPLCMDQYHKILAACRIPGTKKDRFVVYPPYQVNSPRHIVVAHNNHFFALEVLDEDKKPFGLTTIYKLLKNIMKDSQDVAVPLGIMTTEHRDTWGEIYNKLSHDPVNQHSFDKISRSLFLVCLDRPTQVQGHSFNDNIAREALYGGGIASNSGNRWFDKTLQFLIRPDGGLGVTYEHSSAEGPPLIALVDSTLDYLAHMVDNVRKPSEDNHADYEKLKFNLDDSTLRHIDEASRNLEKAGSDLEIRITPFTFFGKDYIKQHKLSPDAFIQLAFQLTFFKLHGVTSATYESGSLRKFQYGRTETIRTLSVDSQAFVEAMLNKTCTVGQRADLLRQAVKAHRAYTAAAMNGAGIDRHMLGLKYQAIELGEEIPEIFTDHSYVKSMYFRLSTSQVPAKHDVTMCFGPAVKDGYGLCYNPHKNHINISCSTFKACPDTSSEKFMKTLHESFFDMKDVLDSEPLQSKL